ncbi:hypothetical protein Hanom_Chr09g00763391 [Helianthus anomalus]
MLVTSVVQKTISLTTWRAEQRPTVALFSYLATVQKVFDVPIIPRIPSLKCYCYLVW